MLFDANGVSTDSLTRPYIAFILHRCVPLLHQVFVCLFVCLWVLVWRYEISFRLMYIYTYSYLFLIYIFLLHFCFFSPRNMEVWICFGVENYAVKVIGVVPRSYPLTRTDFSSKGTNMNVLARKILKSNLTSRLLNVCVCVFACA